MVINSIDTQDKGEDRVWRGISHDITIVKLCLNNMLYDFTSGMPEQVTNKQQDDRVDKEEYSQGLKKTSLKIIKKTFSLVEELELRTKPVSYNDGIYDALTKSPSSSDAAVFRSSLVYLMVTSLKCWEENTGGNKIDLAEKSKLWRVSIDNAQLRVRTMDRYLDIGKLPKVPRIHQVLKTAFFVLKKSKLKLPIRDELEKALSSMHERVGQLPRT